MADERTPAEDAGAADPVPPAKKAAKSTSGKSTSGKATSGKAGGARATKSAKPAKSTKAAGRAAPPKAAPPKAAPAKAAAPEDAPPEAAPAKAAPPKAAEAELEPVKPRSVEPAPAQSQSAGFDRAHEPDVPGAWADAAWQALQQPDQPPRRLAELAVAELGPRAAAWAGWLRDRYPAAPDYGVARLATHEAIRSGTVLALGAAGGPFAAPLLLPATAWVRATVILRVAAAYRQDPTDLARADDLIELLDLDPATTGEPFSLLGFGGIAGAAGQWGLARFAVSRLGLRRTPAAALRVLLAAGDHSDQLALLAHRAIRHFRPLAGVAATAAR